MLQQCMCNFMIISFLVACFVEKTLSQNSVGQLNDTALIRGSLNLGARFYYASDDLAEGTEAILQPDSTYRNITIFGTANTSTKTNTIGDDQVLFYDYFPPMIEDDLFNTMTIIYIHGGGFQGGYASTDCNFYQIEEWIQRGFHGISIEYRRGWLGDGTDSPGSSVLTSADALLAENAFLLAIDDIRTAWDHYNNDSTPGHGRYYSGTDDSKLLNGINHTQSDSIYALIGQSAGGVAATFITTVFEYPNENMTIFGLIDGYGALEYNSTVLESHNDVPVIIVGGLLDSTIPFYTGYAYSNSNVSLSAGTMGTYQKLVDAGYSARMLVAAQGGHGWTQFSKSADSSENAIDYCSSESVFDLAVEDSDNYNLSVGNMSMIYAIRYFYEAWMYRQAGMTTDDFRDNVSPNYQHFRFSQFIGAKYVTNNMVIDDVTYVYPNVADVGGDDLYETIGVKDVLDIDLDLFGLSSDDYIEVDGFNYGCDIQNGLGNLNVTKGFRYEPVQTELEIAISQWPWTVTDIYMKYNFFSSGTAESSYNESDYDETCGMNIVMMSTTDSNDIETSSMSSTSDISDTMETDNTDSGERITLAIRCLGWWCMGVVVVIHQACMF